MTRRSRPTGWRGEPYRHYLAAKGITTKRHAKRYFVNDAAKGNRNAPGDPYASIRKSLNAQGYSAEQQQELFGVPPRDRFVEKKSGALFDVPDADEIVGVARERAQEVPGGFRPEPLESPDIPEQRAPVEAAPMPVQPAVSEPGDMQSAAEDVGMEMEEMEDAPEEPRQDQLSTPGVPPTPPTNPLAAGQSEIFQRFG